MRKAVIFMKRIISSMIVGEILREDSRMASEFFNIGLQCSGCPFGLNEPLEDACMNHGFDVEDIVKILNTRIEAKSI